MKSVEEVIGENVVALRKARGWKQPQLGEALEKATGREWSRQSVWSAERGKRAWAVSELLGLAQVFDVTVGELMTSPETVRVGTVATSPETIRKRTEGVGQLAAHWARYLALISLANVLRQVENEWIEASGEVRTEVTRSAELRTEIEARYARYSAIAENEAREQAARDEIDVSTPAKLKKYMEDWGYNQVPEIRAAKCVLRGAK